LTLTAGIDTPQARLLDFSRRFNEAASRYHELSFVNEIDEEERIYMLLVYARIHVVISSGLTIH
jgi:COP9 signalosome complex subunit 4